MVGDGSWLNGVGWLMGAIEERREGRERERRIVCCARKNAYQVNFYYLDVFLLRSKI